MSPFSSFWNLLYVSLMDSFDLKWKVSYFLMRSCILFLHNCSVPLNRVWMISHNYLEDMQFITLSNISLSRSLNRKFMAFLSFCTSFIFFNKVTRKFRYRSIRSKVSIKCDTGYYFQRNMLAFFYTLDIWRVKW